MRRELEFIFTCKDPKGLLVVYSQALNVRGAASLTPNSVMSLNGLFSRKYYIYYITGVFKIDICTQGSKKT